MHTDALRAGAAAIDITPDDLRGLNAMGPDFESVHDRLHARALVLQAGGATVALVSLDQLEVGSTIELRHRIESATGIPASQVLIAPSHSHNAPRAGVTPAGGLSRAPSRASLDRTPATFTAISDVVAAAQAAAVPARLAVGSGTVDVNVNRNEMRDGNWELGADPDGPSDKTVTVLVVDGLDGRPLATVFTYSVHPTAGLGIPQVSADLAGSAARGVEAGRGGVALWLAGAIGDQAPRASFASLAAAGGAPTEAAVFSAVDEQGAAIAAEVTRTAAALTAWEEQPALAGNESVVRVRTHRGTGLPADMPLFEGTEATLRLTVLRVGDLALAGIGGEVTVPAAEVLLRASRAPRTVIVSIANERIGYLAEPRAFELGQFAARGCPLQPEWLERSAAALDSALRLVGFTA